MATRKRFAWIAVATCAVAGCAPTYDWRETALPGGDGASALFPCRARHLMRRVPLAGVEVEFSLASCEAATTVFAITHASVPAEKVSAALGELRMKMSTNMGGAVATPSSPPHPAGATANAAAGAMIVFGQRPDGSPLQAQAMFFSRGTRVFQITMMSDRINEEVAQTFLSGFKFSR